VLDEQPSGDFPALYQGCPLLTNGPIRISLAADAYFTRY